MSRRDPAVDAWARIEAVLGEALELPPDERAAFLDGADLDEETRAEVESLLAALDREPDFLEAAPPWIAPDPDAGSLPDPSMPERIGSYRVLRPLGHGGPGRVFLAVREAPRSRRRVAIRLMPSGSDADDLLRRFHEEHERPATLDHPNIVRLLDAGATEEGLPYLIMEYVEGPDILEHCRRNSLVVHERLALFCDVCSAVHHAHTRRVVHGNLGPADIRVTDAGVPKLIDLGIARILEPDRAEGDANRPPERPRTPAYSSPERIRGAPVGTACDVWALGVLLYEMLTDRHPFAGAGGLSHAEVARSILERDPPPPSAVALRLRRALASELDTIVFRALRKDPGDRYDSAAVLSEDVRRHLERQPAGGRRVTVRDRIRALVRRLRRR